MHGLWLRSGVRIPNVSGFNKANLQSSDFCVCLMKSGRSRFPKNPLHRKKKEISSKSYEHVPSLLPTDVLGNAEVTVKSETINNNKKRLQKKEASHIKFLLGSI